MSSVGVAKGVTVAKMSLAGLVYRPIREGVLASGINIEDVANGARWTLVVVFALAAVEKIVTLRSGSAAWHPVMLVNPRLRPWATGLMAGSFVVDVVALGLLIKWPVQGGLLASALVVAYSAAAARVHIRGAARECRCIWKLLNASTRKGLVVRNVLLIILAGFVATASPTTSVPGVLWAGVLFGAISGATRLADRGLARAMVTLPVGQAHGLEGEPVTGLRDRRNGSVSGGLRGSGRHE